jgi:dsDNA-specific endonuclease/ATPase MutS2
VAEEEDITTPVHTSELDLQTIAPHKCAEVVHEYVRNARQGGVMRVRLVHEKAGGTLRRIAHAVLDRHDAVESYVLADESSGTWGATIVVLKPISKS